MIAVLSPDGVPLSPVPIRAHEVDSADARANSHAPSETTIWAVFRFPAASEVILLARLGDDPRKPLVAEGAVRLFMAESNG